MTITVMPPSAPDAPRRAGSCGRSFLGVEARVVADDGSAVEAGQPGEVIVRGDVVMAGYWQDANATAQAIVDGWLHTGDIGHLDEHGYLYLTDRKRDVIITGGANVYPREVEEVLLLHPGVESVAVAGVPDSEWGESVWAFVVPTCSAPPTEHDLVAHCREHLASFKKPRRIEFLEALPVNAAGKVLKRVLVDQAAMTQDSEP
jgi:acyl-CoA synthetase (AMP-forming)/AMP-acid ligase II